MRTVFSFDNCGGGAAFPLVATPQSLSFGPGWADDSFSWAVMLTNQGDETVRVSQMMATCDCTSVEPTSFELQPGATQELQLTLDLTRTMEPGQLQAPFSVDLLPTLKDGRSSVLSVEGTIQVPVVAIPERLDFGPELQLDATPEPQILQIRYADEIEAVKLGFNSERLRVDRQETSSDSAHSDCYLVTLLAGHQLGDITETISLVPVTQDGQSLPSHKVLVKAKVVSDINWWPESVVIVPQPSDAAQSETILLSSLSSDPFEIVDVRCLADWLECSTEEKREEGGSHEVPITITLSDDHPQGTVTDDGEGTEIVVRIRRETDDDLLTVKVPVAVVRGPTPVHELSTAGESDGPLAKEPTP